jgi:hypothetical protein
LTVRVKAADEVCFCVEESVTATVIVKRPVFEVVPESDPADCMVIPAGSEPEKSVQV